jgi:hypothetical protein
MAGRSAGLLIAVALAPAVLTAQSPTQPLPPYLRDRGTGVRMSMLGTYVRDGELLIYPFFEWYADHNLEYKPSELGYGLNRDYRGRFRASEGILFFAYGISPDLAVEFESAVITAELRKSASDSATVPQRFRESGLGDVEGQIRWRVQRENEHRPEVYTFFETVLPLQRTRHIIGTQDWEFSAGFGLTRGFRWGTMTFRASAEYAREARQIDAGEYAIEYMRQVSPAWRVITAVEGTQVDEVTLLTEVQWRFARNAIFKMNNGWGLTPNATDIAPEVGVMFNF